MLDSNLTKLKETILLISFEKKKQQASLPENIFANLNVLIQPFQHGYYCRYVRISAFHRFSTTCPQISPQLLLERPEFQSRIHRLTSKLEPNFCPTLPCARSTRFTNFYIFFLPPFLKLVCFPRQFSSLARLPHTPIPTVAPPNRFMAN